MKLIEQNKQKLNQLCMEHHVEKLHLFGSILTDQFNDESDIDMLIQFSSINLEDYFDNYMDFKEKVELLFDRAVDLIENQAIKNPVFRKVIDREKQLIYG
ncbi:nucleotidyltransferase domain-containing protein [Flavobacterium sp. KACC 22761]|uniref:nucleotidyltransferase family protein n=1 Tax=Flavobacterium sp. KACC 22761 TaxID=3092665 RepID=UPI002A7611F3|nr:nucleotidyltransferase domain-containing protein [Flavobacterium sp. KACC 22761]WPO80312.1 nucleotidyltransferase domain-containing protein [Flavobacterium sp. KACC 22761]